MRAPPTERIAGIAFFIFVLIQVPFFVVNTPLSSHGFVMLSPLQVTGADIARRFPELIDAVNLILVPGGWLRDSLSPFLRCQYQTSGRGPCGTYVAKLYDIEHIKRSNNLPTLVQLLNNGIPQQSPILYGCASIVVSAVFCLFSKLKSAVLGFILLAYGVMQGNHTPLPSAVLMAFLIVYAGFNLEGGQANTRRQRQQQGRHGNVIKRRSSSADDISSTSDGIKAGASGQKGHMTPTRSPSAKPIAKLA